MRLCSSSEQIAELIVTYTKALADRPFKYYCDLLYHLSLLYLERMMLFHFMEI